jgi:hypothetical protein
MKRMLAAALLAASVITLPLLAAEATSVAALVEAYEHPTVGPSAPVQDVTIKVSPNMTIHLASGNAARITAGDEAGLFFVGDGTFEYTSAEPLETKIVEFETKKASDLTLTSAADKRTLKGTFKQLYLREHGIALPELKPGGIAAVAEAFKKHRDDFGIVRPQIASHLLAMQKLDVPASPVAVAEFAGGGRPVWYILDSIDNRTEGVYALQKINDARVRYVPGDYWTATISEQPIGRSRRVFTEPRYLLTDLDYSLIAEANETAKLSVTETIQPRNTAQRVFRFALNSEVIDTAKKRRDVTLTKVTDEAGNELSFDHRGGDLVVGFAKPVPPNTPVKIHFEIEGNFLYHPNANSFWQLGTEPWFPQPDLNGQYYKIHSLVKVKKPYVPFAPGETIRREVEGDYNVTENRITDPVQFAVVHAGKYAFDEKKYDDGLTIRIASYASNNTAAMKQLSNLSWKLIKFYEPFLGPFPFKEFNIIEINELGFGQAPPATMFITAEAFNPLQSSDNMAYSKGINQRFAHEIAHQYWGHVVKMGSAEEQWVTESFAEYCSALAVKQIKGQNGYDAMVATWRGNANDVHNVSSIPFANRIAIPSDPYSGFIDRAYLIYDKGALLLSALHKQLGDTKFLTFLRSLQGFYRWKYLATDDMPKLLAKIDPGKDYAAFFEQYFWGTDVPK